MSQNPNSTQASGATDGGLSEKVANALLHESIDPILIGDVENHVLEWSNPAGLHMLGRTADEIKGLPLSDIHPPKDLSYVLDQFNRQASGDYRLAKDIPVLSTTGEVRYYDVQSVLVRFGEKDHLMGCFRDITERRLAEHELHESEDRFQMALKSAPMGLFIYGLEKDGSLVMLDVNPACSRILGIDVTALLGLTIEEAFPPLGETEVPDAYRRVAREGGVWHNVSVEYEDKRISGAFEVLAFQVKPGQTGVFFWDITERRKAEEEMSRMMAAMNALGDSIMMTDSKGIIQYVNPFFENLTGYTLGEVKGKHIGSLKSGAHDKAYYSRIWDVLARGEVWSGTFINKKKDGTVYHESASISPVKDPQGHVVSYVAVKRDMTHELDLERRVLRSQKMAALGQFAHRVAHDVTNGLSIIMGSAEILGKMAGNETGKELSDTIVSAVDKISGLTTSLMAFAHPGALNTHKIKVAVLINGMREMIERACKPNIAVEYDLDETLRVDVDASQIEQALMHLVINATEAIEKNGDLKIAAERGMMPAQIAAEGDSVDGEVPAAIIVLTDNGAGLTREECERAFEPFFSTKRDLRRNAGLGLATVYSIVARHNGDITIKSTKNVGTELRIALPLVE